jgi:hypothetical protein
LGPVVEDISLVVAHLPFAGGELLLRSDRTLQVVPTEALRERHRQFAEAADETALKWGTSLVVGLAAVGAAAYTHGWRPVGWAFFGLSGLSGLFGRSIRRAAQDWNTAAFAPHPLAKALLTTEADGALQVVIAGSPNTPPWTLRLEPGEFDPSAATVFRRAYGELLRS